MNRYEIRREFDRFIELPTDDKSMVTTTSALLFAEHIASLIKKKVDCNICVNRGRTDGLSQESHCDHCIYQENWRTNHYEGKK